MEQVVSTGRRNARGQVVPFFVLNDHLEKERLLGRLQECARAKFDGVILHARAGLRTPYLSEAWFEAIGYCIQEAGHLGMKSWLYDEFPYPSGVAGGRVIQKDPRFAETHLSVRRLPFTGGRRVVLGLGHGRLLEAFLVPIDKNGRRQWDGARRATASVGMRNTTWISRDWDSRHYYAPEHSKIYSCRRAIDVLPEQAFEQDIPEGRWELITYFLETGGDFLEPFGHYVDVSNADATRAFLKETHEAYNARFGEAFGTQVPGIYSDEPKYRNSLPWSDAIAREWDAYRQDPRALLSLLPDGEGTESRRDYRRATSRLFGENWVGPIRDWCDRHQLQLIGHISPEESWWGEGRCAGSILRHLRRFSIPGCDLIIPAVGDREHLLLNCTTTLAVSAAAQSGASYALCEVFGCSNYDLDLQTVKRVGDWLTSCGINFIVPHGCFYSVAGLRRFDAPPTFLPPSTLHRGLDVWAEHIREVTSSLGPQGIATKVAIVRPTSHLQGLADDARSEAEGLFRRALECVRSLLERGIPFHWLDEDDLAEAHIESDALRVQSARYEKIVVDEALASAQTQDVLRRCRLAGVGVLSYEMTDLLEGPLVCPAGDVRAVRSAEGRYFCVNLSSEPRCFVVEKTECILDGYESRWITPGVHARRRSQDARTLVLGGDWQVRPLERNVFRLNSWISHGKPWVPGPIYEMLSSESGAASTVYGKVPLDPVLRKSHCFSYESSFIWEGRSMPLGLWLEEGSISGHWRAFLNGEYLGDWRKTQSIWGGQEHALGELLCQGTNRIRVDLETCDLRDGLLMAPVLAGDFIVLDSRHARLGPMLREFRGNDWTAIGFPHYSGTMDFELAFDWSGAAPKQAELVFRYPPAGAVTVILNERELGRLLWSPWRIGLGEGLRDGRNELRLRVTNTLSNFIYGKGRASGPLGGAEIRAYPAAGLPWEAPAELESSAA